MLADARAHWADHCAACHANNGSGDTAMGKHTYPPTPDMRQAETQNLTDGELFYIIQNGSRLTRMPSWVPGRIRMLKTPGNWSGSLAICQSLRSRRNAKCKCLIQRVRKN
ncbi:MAG: c-type cytochrome [Bryobacteraceae bacterium]